MSEPELVEHGEREVRREPLPCWMCWGCVLYLSGAVAVVVYAGYALARALR